VKFSVITFVKTGKTAIMRTDGKGNAWVMASDGTFTQVDSLPMFTCKHVTHFADTTAIRRVTSN
jgi:hypothetical protein